MKPLHFYLFALTCGLLGLFACKGEHKFPKHGDLYYMLPAPDDTTFIHFMFDEEKVSGKIFTDDLWTPVHKMKRINNIFFM